MVRRAGLGTILSATAVLCAACGSGRDDDLRPTPEVSASLAAQAATEAEERARQEALDRDWPLHGLVTGLQLVVRGKPEPEAPAIGWLRIGARVRLKDEPVKTPTCASGWYPILPLGHVCVGEGVTVGGTPPTAEFAVAPPAREAALPYAYWFVKDEAVPEYHRLPSRDEQREAMAFRERYLVLRAKNEKQAERFRRGEVPGDVAKPAVLHRLLDRGFFIASTGIEERAFRKFVRTVRGRYVKQAELEPREGGTFVGVELKDGDTLPVVWAVRSARPLLRRERADGTVKMIEDDALPVFDRHGRIQGWQGRTNVGGTVYHRVLVGGREERFVKDWFLAVAETVPKPREIRKGEPWVHVDLSSQTLVVYRDAEPLYATLVSTGMEGFETKPGLHTVSRKYVADTMANVGDTLDDRYSIEDVPWTQYFQGSIALHGAFWHSGFGIPRSHGCVNLSPLDAHWVFNVLWPTIPDGWLGVVADLTPFPESHVLITE